MNPFNKLFNSKVYNNQPVIIMDGGMGTTLNSPPFSEGLNTTLWSSELLKSIEGQEKLNLLNQIWIKSSGVEILGSCSYQSSLPLFLPSTSSTTPSPPTAEETSQALSTMLSALPIVTFPYPTSSSSLPSSSSPPSSTDVKQEGKDEEEFKFTSRSSKPYSLLSLGPFGAQLVPGQEYTGIYPFPFGPRTSNPIGRDDDDDESIGKLPFNFDQNEINKGTEGESEIFLTKIKRTQNSIEDYLTSFHLNRLIQFSNSDSFKDLNIIGFETIPNLIEVKSIRRAIFLFNSLPIQQSSTPKPFYISYVFPVPSSSPSSPLSSPKARHPSPSHTQLPSSDLLDLLLSTTFQSEKGYSKPNGIGINCTNPNEVERLVKGISSRMKELDLLDDGDGDGGAEGDEGNGEGEGGEEGGERPWLILYPDGGSVYDVVTRTWSTPTGLSPTSWSSLLISSISLALSYKRTISTTSNSLGSNKKIIEKEIKLWGGIIAGGCCKAGFESIRELRKGVEERGWMG